MRYQITNGTVSLQGETILNHIDFEIRGNEKIAVVGRNGAGKTTLLRLIAGELSLDRDDKRFGPGIFLAGNTTIGMLRQGLLSGKNCTIEEEMQELCPVKEMYSRERYDFEKEYDRIFTGLGFSKEEKKKKIQEFSGGEQTKIAMIKLLLLKPDILLLDEPTNHLDIHAVEWMEEYIASYKNAVLIVSHDRFFLDRTVDVVYEISGGKLTRYAGNYSAYKKQREKNRQLQKKKYEEQQRETERLTALIEKFKHKPKKASMARAKKKMLERMPKVEKPSLSEAYIFTEKIVPDFPGSKEVLKAERLQIGYEKPLKELTLRIRRGQKIGVIGANGSGKTTFIRTITGQIPPLSGMYQLGNHIKTGYFDQHTGELISEKRVWEHFHEKNPALMIKEVKKILGKYLFYGDDTAKKVSDLSGGEKSRLVLAEILESRPNVLILDEPTNHMDIPAKETMESAFSSYTGTMLFISHDRYFLKEVADSLLIFEEDKVSYYPFGYEHYVEHLRKKKEFGWAGAQAAAVENSMLMQELSEVPEKTRMQSARFSTEQSYADWQLTLAGEQLDRVRNTLERFLDTLEELYTGKDWEREKNEEKQWEEQQHIIQEWEKEYERHMGEYTEECLHWYEKWLDYQEVFEHYRD